MLNLNATLSINYQKVSSKAFYQFQVQVALQCSNTFLASYSAKLEIIDVNAAAGSRFPIYMFLDCPNLRSKVCGWILQF